MGSQWEKLITILPGDRVLEVGPGNFPYSAVSYYLDISDNGFARKLDRPLIIGNVENLPFSDKCFDVVVCSHVLEHVSRPGEATQELMRVGLRGIIEVPSEIGDWVTQHGNVHRLWKISSFGNTLIFIKMSERERVARDNEDMRNWAWNMAWSENIDRSQHIVRNAYTKSDMLNIVATWNLDCSVGCMVIE